MNRLTELQNSLAKQNELVHALTVQAERSSRDENRRLLRKRERAAFMAQAIQHDIDATLHRVAYLQQAARLAQENPEVIARYIASAQLTNLVNADGWFESRATARHEIDRSRLEIAGLGTPDATV